MPAAGGFHGFRPDYAPGPVLSLFFVPALVFAAAVTIGLIVILWSFLFRIRDIVGPLFGLLVLALAHGFRLPFRRSRRIAAGTFGCTFPSVIEIRYRFLNILLRIRTENPRRLHGGDRKPVDYLFSSAMVLAAVRPETKISTIALPPRRLPPWIPPVTSPAA